jgi:hypothetical protein
VQLSVVLITISNEIDIGRAVETPCVHAR